jgi:hypothetical protein
MSALIPNPSITGQTTCQAMSEPNFWNSIRSKKARISVIRKNSRSTAWTTSMY